MKNLYPFHIDIYNDLQSKYNLIIVDRLDNEYKISHIRDLSNEYPIVVIDNNGFKISYSKDGRRKHQHLRIRKYDINSGCFAERTWMLPIEDSWDSYDLFFKELPSNYNDEKFKNINIFSELSCEDLTNRAIKCKTMWLKLNDASVNIVTFYDNGKCILSNNTCCYTSYLRDKKATFLDGTPCYKIF